MSLDHEIRIIAFNWLSEQVSIHGDGNILGSEYVFLRAPGLTLSDSPIKTVFQSQNKMLVSKNLVLVDGSPDTGDI